MPSVFFRMQLPNADHVIIDEAKIRDYLLAPEHPVGRFKAAFFAALGYQQPDWSRLASDLRRLAATGDVLPGPASPYGAKFRVRGILQGPAGRGVLIETVWLVRAEEELPRFVTAFPGD
jgi:hypothetical protein